ncbi:hypothetical protein [Streptomyces sp. NPDC059224]|uniref:hypothetical protein n=1 Tax=Streptomyces sp. NPDC059224 TaxID=3346775 RepID=UPI0036CB1B59
MFLTGIVGTSYVSGVGIMHFPRITGIAKRIRCNQVEDEMKKIVKIISGITLANPAKAERRDH